jgi:RNA polymerase sporulation-specific sigma factor
MDKLAEKDSENEALLNRMVLKELISGLGLKERQIILKRYFENRTQTAIANELGISKVQVSRLEKKILKELKEKLTER